MKRELSYTTGLFLCLALAVGACSSTTSNMHDAKMEAVEDHADKHVHVVERQREYEVDRAETRADLRENKVSSEEDREIFSTNVASRLEKIAIRLDEAERKAGIQKEETSVEFS